MSALLNAVAPLLAHGQTTHDLPLEKLLKAPLPEFLAGTMKSAPGIFTADPDDRRRLLDAFDDATERREKADVFRAIFQQARETVVVDGDRDVLLWCQTLIESLFGFAITSNEAESELDHDNDNKTTSRGLSFASATKKYRPQQPKKPRRYNNDDGEYRPEDSGDEDRDGGSSRKSESRRDKDQRSSRKEESSSSTGRSSGSGGGRRRKETVITDEALEIADYAFGKRKPPQGGYYCSGHFFPSEEGYVALLATLKQVKETLDICVFTITDDRIADVIIEAQRRRVQVRIITDDAQAKCLGADPYRLRDEHKIKVITDHGVAFMHNKFAILDDKVLITGSYNWTVAAHYNNNENIVILNHTPTIKSYKQEFNRLWELFHEEERQGKGSSKS